jgi:hypothetical protein
MAKSYFDPKDVNERVEQVLIKEGEVSAGLPWRSAIH